MEDDTAETSEQQPTTSDSQQQRSASGTAGATTSDKNKRRYFTKELRCMMYGFGDDKVPYTESVDLLDEIVVEYIRAVTLRAMEIGKPGKVGLEDVWYLMRREPRKYARVKELLSMNEELKRARKAFDEAKY